MRFEQLFKRMAYNSIAKVYRVTEHSVRDDGTVTTQAEYVDAFSRYDKVPEAVRSSYVSNVDAESESTLTVLIEAPTAAI